MQQAEETKNKIKRVFNTTKTALMKITSVDGSSDRPGCLGLAEAAH